MFEKIKNLVKDRVSRLAETGAIHVVVGSFMTKFVSLFGSIFVVRLLSKQDYGILSYYENFIGYFSIFAGLGLASGVQRYLVLIDDYSGKKNCLLYAMKKGSIINLCLIALACLICYFYPHKEAFEPYKALIIPLALCIPFVFAAEAVFSSLRALFDYRKYAYMSFGVATALIAARLFGAVTGGIRGLLWMRLAMEIACVFVCVYVLFHSFFRETRPRSLEKPFLREMNTYSFQVMLTNGLWTIFMLNDLFLLGQLLGDETIIAEYKVAYVIPANLSILTAAIATFVAPYFTKYEHEKNYAWIKEKFKLVLSITGGIVGIFVLICLVLAKPMIWLLYGKEYYSSIPVMRVLLIASFFNNGIRASIANILSSMGAQKANLAVAGVGIVIQVTLDVLLIPTLGGMGVALSSTVVYFVMSMSLLYYFIKNYVRKEIA